MSEHASPESNRGEAAAAPAGNPVSSDVEIHLNKKLAAISAAERMIALGVWLIAFSLVLTAGYLGWRVRVTAAATITPEVVVTQSFNLFAPEKVSVQLPELISSEQAEGVKRQATMHTIIPTRPRDEAIEYTVTTGDSVFGIAQKFGIKPETVLWANYALLNDSPDSLSPGMELQIPPVDGVYYEWGEGDTLEAIASQFKAKAEEILNWPGNKIDLTNPEFAAGSFIMIPGGEREFRQWVVPVIPREKAGVSKSVYGPGACEGSYDGAYGAGFFVWPAASHSLSGNDFWSGHLGIDIAGGIGDSVFAADSGVIVFAGWATGGYGYMIMVDHGNGYQSVYAHLSNVGVGCGQSVYQSQYIGSVGSTGNSTGPHLHFEVRYLGGFLNPWHVLPAP